MDEVPLVEAPSSPVIKRGERFFCPSCGHLMAHQLPECSGCHTVFDGLVEEGAHPPPELAETIEEEEEAGRQLKYIWSGFLILIIGAGVVLLFLLLRR